MDHLDDYPMMNQVNNIPVAKLSFYDRNIGIGEEIAYDFGTSNYGWRPEPKNLMNSIPEKPLVCDSFSSQSGHPSNVTFPIQAQNIENSSLINQEIQECEHADRQVLGCEKHNTNETSSCGGNYFYEPLICLNTTQNENSTACGDKGKESLPERPEPKNIYGDTIPTKSSVCDSFAMRSELASETTFPSRVQTGEGDSLVGQERRETEHTEGKAPDHEQAMTTSKTTTTTTAGDNYFYEPLICLNTNPNNDNTNVCEREEEDEEEENFSEHSEDLNSVKSEKLDADYSGIESDDYSDDSESESENYSESELLLEKPTSSKRIKRNVIGEVYVRCSQNVGGKRCYGKVQYCIFCSINGKNYNGFTNLTKHILKYHEREPQVGKILEIPKRDPERKLLLEKVRNLGNYEHNMRVLRENCGEIIPWRCPPNPVSYKKYVPCKCCKGFFQKKDLWRHLRACPFNKNSDQPSRGCAKEAAMLLPTTCEASTAVLSNVFMKMQSDEITSIVKNDKLITLYAEKLYSKHGTDDQCHMMISQKLREIGRLMIEVRKRNSAVDTLSKCLTPEHYQVVCEATRIVAGFDEATSKYKTPSLALKIGHALNKCCSIKQGVATEMNDELMEKETQKFQAAMNCSWTSEVSRNALKTLKEAKWNSPTVVPLAEDILRLQQFVSSEMVIAEKNLMEEVSKNNWKSLCRLCLTSIILLNRKRSGEISRMLLSSYLNRGMSTATPEVVSALTPIEREMSKTFIRVEILGKDGRIAPFIFTPFIIAKTDVLVSTRDSVGVNKENKYLFAHPFEGAETHVRGHDCLREYSKRCGAHHPFSLTGANLKNFISASPY